MRKRSHRLVRLRASRVIGGNPLRRLPLDRPARLFDEEELLVDDEEALFTSTSLKTTINFNQLKKDLQFSWLHVYVVIPQQFKYMIQLMKIFKNDLTL